MFNTPFIVPVAFAAAWVLVTWLRGKYGMAGPAWHHKHNVNVPPMFEKMMDKAMQDRDAELAKLRERVEVLERIVTDRHKSDSLSEEIERLRERS